MKSAKRIIAESTGLILAVTLVLLLIASLVTGIHSEYLYNNGIGDIKSSMVMFGIVTFLRAVILQFVISWFVLLRYYKGLKRTQTVKNKYFILSAGIASIVPIILVITTLVILINYFIKAF